MQDQQKNILWMYNFGFTFNNFKEGWDLKAHSQIVICETKSIFRNIILPNQDNPQKNTVKHNQDC